MERALVVGTVAEETYRDETLAEHAGGKRCTDGERQTRTDDAVGAEEAAAEIHEVHRAALALAAARLLAIELGDQRFRFATLGQEMAMRTVSADDFVRAFDCRAGADRNGLFADTQMQQSGNLHAPLAICDLLIADTQHNHQAQHVHQLSVGRHCVRLAFALHLVLLPSVA